ncbi:MAG: branched-chain amino acid ABC transporter permease [Candidimonas sp.]|nr:MAG: branched-chain amino acid ABC transporter permease [Candidimonas sp.]
MFNGINSIEDRWVVAANAGSRRHKKCIGRLALYLLPLIALLVAWSVNPYVEYVLNLVLIYVLVTVGFNVILGNTGQLAFASVVFFGVGAYTTSILIYHLHWPFWVTIIPAGVVSCLFAIAMSAPALRGVRSFYLAMLTLAFVELMRWIYVNAESLTLGSGGISLSAPTLFGYTLDTEFKKFAFFLAIVVILVKATSNLLRSRIGRAFMAVRDNELAAAGVGISAAQYVVLGFGWGGFVIGIAGSLYAGHVQLVSPDAFSVTELILHFAMVIVGGIGSLAGSVLGAAVLSTIPEAAQQWPGVAELFLGGAIMIVLLFVPRGLISLLDRHVPILRDRYHGGD